MKNKTIVGLIAIIVVVMVVGYVIFADSDGDGWSDFKEKNAGTNPYNVDTDADGIWDPHDPNPLIASSTTPTETPVSTPTPKSETTSAIVSNVIDGDTVKLQNGEKVRLLGINTPEMGQPYYEEATNRLKQLIEGKTVTLEKDVDDKDQYGRLLRYIYIDDTFVNLEMVREGYANVYIVPPNTKYSDEFEKTEEEAKIAKKGIWQPSEEGLSKCIGILYFHWNAEGNDCYNLNDEYVTFKNTCSQPINMTGWTVKDEVNHIYTFPDFNLAGGATVTLYTGTGVDTTAELYWNSSGHQCNAIWNNDGDTLYLRDISGNLVISYSYGGFE